jgi:ketosteroid isomerase-like protein
MSENVGLVRSILAEWERGDFSSADWAHPEIEYVVVGGPEPGTWIGRAQMAQARGRFMGAWTDYRAWADDYRVLDDQRVLVLAHPSGRGKTSGLEIAKTPAGGAILFHVCGNQITRLVIYIDLERARSDLGLEPQAVSQDNVEIVRGSLEAFNARELETAADALDPDIEWAATARFIDEGVIHGRAAVLEYWKRVLATFPLVHENLRFLAAGENVCVLADIRVQGVGSGVELAQPCGYVMTVRASAITRVRYFRTHAEALKAVGLEE